MPNKKAVSPPDALTKNHKLMKISEFAKANELSARALRLYEEQGLIKPAVKNQAGFRFYTHEQQVRLQYIQKMKDLGCSLAEIQSLIQNWGQQTTAAQGMQALETLYNQKLQEVRTVIQRLKEIEADLAESLSFIQECHHCSTTDAPQTACHICERTTTSNLTLIRGVMEGCSS